MRTFVKDLQIEYLQKKQVPFVTIGSSNYRNVVQIDHDHRSACRELTSLILLKKMRKVALIGGDESHVVTQNRVGGFMEAHAELELPVDESLLALNLENHVVAEKKVEELIANGAECILCLDDAICSRVLKVLREKHVKVPEDVRIASFYNSSVLANNVPSITSLDFEPKELGMVACQVLLDLIEEKDVEERTLLSYHVVLKESTQ